MPVASHGILFIIQHIWCIIDYSKILILSMWFISVLTNVTVERMCMTVIDSCVSSSPAAEAAEHTGRPVSPDADVRQRKGQLRGPPVGRECAAGVCGALQPSGLLSHHHVLHGHAEVRATQRPLQDTHAGSLLMGP